MRFENLGVVDPVTRNFRFHPPKNSIFQTKFSTFFSRQLKKLSFLPQNFNFYQSDLHSWTIFLFFFKQNHCPTYFLCKVGYNNFQRPVHDLPATLRAISQPKIWGRDTPTPRIDAYE